MDKNTFHNCWNSVSCKCHNLFLSRSRDWNFDILVTFWNMIAGGRFEKNNKIICVNIHVWKYLQLIQSNFFWKPHLLLSENGTLALPLLLWDKWWQYENWPLGLVTTTLLFASRLVCSTGRSEATISARKLMYLEGDNSILRYNFPGLSPYCES